MSILNKLTIRHLKMNKKRTVVTIIGVILSTALMVGIGLIFSTIRDSSIKNYIEYNGDYHLAIDLKKADLSLLENDSKIAKYDTLNLIGYSLFKESETRWQDPYIKVVTANDEYLSKLKIIKGRLPENENEIVLPNHIFNYNEVSYELDMEITLNLGIRYLEEELDKNVGYKENETLINTKTKTYKIVGIIERSIYESFSEPSYLSFTKNGDITDKVEAYVKYKNPKNTYKKATELADLLGYKKEYGNYEKITYNDGLLAMYGISKYSNLEDAMVGIIIVILTLISIGCIVVIYNSFAISVMERKKQFGLFASIGATRSQLGKTVFYEAFIVGIIGIPLGILSSFVGIGIVIQIINSLMSEVLGNMKLSLAVYPIFIYIPMIFMILTIIISAYLPAKIASRVSPISAIRQNNDIKINSKEIKMPKWIVKAFGIEGEIAYKNMKRNKKRYRVTFISLLTSIVLFISFSGFADYLIKTSMDYARMPSFDIYLNSYSHDEKAKTFFEKVKNDQDVLEYTEAISYYSFALKKPDNQFFTEEYLENLDKIDKYNNYPISLHIKVLNDKSYTKYLKELGLKEEKPILINMISAINYNEDYTKRKNVKYNIFKKSDISIEIFNQNFDSEPINYPDISTTYRLDNIYLTDKLPFGVEYSTSSNQIILLLSEKEMQKIDTTSTFKGTELYLKTPTYDSVQKVIDEYIEANNDGNMYSYNVKKEAKILSDTIFIIKLLMYGFISLVTLIGVTSVFNTINTSINLRKREFAMLRSIGLTPKGFNKILYYESFFFGLKSLLFGIPVALVVVYILHKLFDTIVTFTYLIIPWKSILFAVIAVFAIILMTMLYSAKKIKKENILEAIRLENI